MTSTMPGQTALLPDPIEHAFLAYHHANPHVYNELVRLARRWKAAGHDKTSIAMLFEVLRWQVGLAGATDEASPFRLSNNYKPHYARLIQANEPDLAGIFDLKPLFRRSGTVAA